MNPLEKLSSLPAWAIEGAIGLIVAVGKLFNARSDDEREQALMEAAEATKAALDRKKFG